MHKPNKITTKDANDFVAGGGDAPMAKTRKKAITVNRRNVTRTDDDDKKIEILIDTALDFKNDAGRRFKLNASEASSLGIDAALYLLKNDPDTFAKMLKWTKENRITD